MLCVETNEKNASRDLNYHWGCYANKASGHKGDHQ